MLRRRRSHPTAKLRGQPGEEVEEPPGAVGYPLVEGARGQRGAEVSEVQGAETRHLLPAVGQAGHQGVEAAQLRTARALVGTASYHLIYQQY